jgi:hypothetical protein
MIGERGSSYAAPKMRSQHAVPVPIRIPVSMIMELDHAITTMKGAAAAQARIINLFRL